jgi:hypothetical protein
MKVSLYWIFLPETRGRSVREELQHLDFKQIQRREGHTYYFTQRSGGDGCTRVCTSWGSPTGAQQRNHRGHHWRSFACRRRVTYYTVAGRSRSNRRNAAYFALNAAACSLTELPELPLLLTRETEDRVRHCAETSTAEPPSHPTHQPRTSWSILHRQSAATTKALASLPVHQKVTTTLSEATRFRTCASSN